MADFDGRNDSENKSHHRLVIIGGGISGVSAGHDLMKAGFTDFVILEASERIGGRIKSIDVNGLQGQKAEMGANWIHGIDLNPIYKIAVENNLLATHYSGRKLGQKIMFLTEDGAPVNTKMVAEVDWDFGIIMGTCEDFYQSQIPTPYGQESVGAYVEHEFESKLQKYHGRELELRRMILQQRLLGESIISGCHLMSELALSEVGSFQELPGVHFVIPPGFESIVHILAESIPKDQILLDHPVSRIDWDRDSHDENRQICIECQNGKKFYCDQVLCTVSLGYLKRHAGRLFSPPLPEVKLDAISRLKMGVVDKVILEFDGQVLPDGVFRLEMIWDRSNVENEDISESWVKKIGCYEAISDNVLVGWLCGREAEYMESLSEEQVGRQCVDAIKKFTRKAWPKIPKLKRVIQSKWKQNPYTCGSYCYVPCGTLAEEVDNMAEPILDKDGKPIILFAGEATHGQFYSSSHGALLSGKREAERILETSAH